MFKKKEHLVRGNETLKKNIAYRVRTLAGVNYLFGENLCFELNEVANDIWDSINGFDDIQTIIDSIAESYDVSACEIREDILGFVDNMMEHHVFIAADE